MARYIGAMCRLCRREGKKLYLKGDRCATGKCAMERRPFAPGQHGKNKTKMSEYGTQLREKQQAKRIYGVLERQFENYFDEADRRKGITGENLLVMLETRLDNVIYRAGYGRSRVEARQVVRHNHVRVNGGKVNIPSYQVKAGDVVTLKDKSQDIQRFKDILDTTDSRVVPEWLAVDRSAHTVTINALPQRDQIDTPIEETLIVELYSK